MLIIFSITKNLRALGYEKDIESIKYPDSLDEHKLVKVPQRLTERSASSYSSFIYPVF